jgi:hypothetical protein
MGALRAHAFGQHAHQKLDESNRDVATCSLHARSTRPVISDKKTVKVIFQQKGGYLVAGNLNGRRFFAARSV